MVMAKKLKVKWACPRCTAPANNHGKGGEEKCMNRHSGACSGFICDCDEDTTKDHGVTFDDPCPQANCYHCGWGGEFPAKPTGLKPWEKKALEAGWVMPAQRMKELGLG